MTTRRQKALGLDTVRIEDVPAGHAVVFSNLMEMRAKNQGKTLSEVFQDLTEKLAIEMLGPEEAERTIWCNTGIYKRDLE